jgi:hypothetical protein
MSSATFSSGRYKKNIDGLFLGESSGHGYFYKFVGRARKWIKWQKNNFKDKVLNKARDLLTQSLIRKTVISGVFNDY